MQKQLIMGNLKNSLIIVFTILSILIFGSFVFYDQDDNLRVEVETVRKDVLNHELFMVPEEYIKELETQMFRFFYLENYCLIHIPYYAYEADSYDKCSLIAIYVFRNKEWHYKKTIPYYFKISLLDANEKLFLSDNFLCKTNGSCNSHTTISLFDGEDMSNLVNYSGFDDLVYYNFLLSKEDTLSVKKVFGDTITNRIHIINYGVNDKGEKRFDLLRNFRILQGINDSLVTRTINSKTSIYLKDLK